VGASGPPPTSLTDFASWSPAGTLTSSPGTPGLPWWQGFFLQPGHRLPWSVDEDARRGPRRCTFWQTVALAGRRYASIVKYKRERLEPSLGPPLHPGWHRGAVSVLRNHLLGCFMGILTGLLSRQPFAAIKIKKVLPQDLQNTWIRVPWRYSVRHYHWWL
jgi:hypothetical protein